MTRPRENQIVTHDLDLGALFMVETDRMPGIFREPGNPLVTLSMPNDEATRDLMIAYASGTLKVDVKKFASCRAWLFRQVKGVK